MLASRHADPMRAVTPKCELLYNSRDCLFRFDLVRRMIERKGIDAAMFVGGVDSRDNEGCLQGINFLLLGGVASDLSTPLLLDEDLDDTIIIIHKGGSRIYTTPNAGPKITHFTSRWPGVELISIDKKAFNNQDAFEDHKISSFRDLVSNLKVIGVSITKKAGYSDILGDGGVGQIEKWPIIQSYALDDEGRRSFFTQCHQVVNIAEGMDQVYRCVSNHDIRVMLTCQVKLLSQHWSGLTDSVQRSTRKGISVSEATSSCENLLTYFKYGSMRRSSMLSLWGITEPTIKLFDHKLHAIVQATDPQAPIYGCRTMFLSSGIESTLDRFGGKSEYLKGILPLDKSDASFNKSALKILSEVYYVLLVTVRKVLRETTSKVTNSSFWEILKKVASDSGVEIPEKSELTLKQVYVDNGAYISTSTPGKNSSHQNDCLLSITARLSNITNTSTNTCLGDVAYGDTAACNPHLILTSAITDLSLVASQQYEHMLCESTLQVFEKCSEIWASLKTEPTPEASKNIIEHLNTTCPLKSFFCTITYTTGAYLYPPIADVEAAANDVVLTGGRHAMFSHGVVFTDATAGALQPLIISSTMLTGIRVYSSSFDQPSYVIFDLTEDFDFWIPLQTVQRCSGTSKCLILCLNGPSKREFVRTVLPSWKQIHGELILVVQDLENSNVPKYFIKEAPNNKDFVSYQRNSDVASYRPFNSGSTEEESDFRVWRRSVTDNESSFMELNPEFELFSKNRRIAQIQRLDQTNTAEPNQINQTNFNINKEIISSLPSVTIDVITGWWGTGKHKIATQLSRVINSLNASSRQSNNLKEQQVITIVTSNDGNDEREACNFNPVVFYRKLREATTAITEENKDKKCRICFVTSGSTAISTVINHLSQFVRNSQSINVIVGSVTAVVHSDYLYQNHLSGPDHFQLVTGLTDQLTDGFVSQVLITARDSIATVNDLESFVRRTNGSCKIVFGAEEAIENILSSSNMDSSEFITERSLGFSNVVCLYFFKKESNYKKGKKGKSKKKHKHSSINYHE